MVQASSWMEFYSIVSDLKQSWLFRMIKWHPPVSNLFKLNTDRCSRGKPGSASGGGVLRDSNGNLVLGFPVYFGHLTSVQAEARALLFAIKLCLQYGFLNLHLELDSLLLVQILNKISGCP